MNSQDTFFNPLRSHINNQLLKYAAGLYMFCPNCQNVLDWKTTVSIDFFQGGKHLKNLVCCTSCFKPSGIETLKAQGITAEVTEYEDNQTKTQ
jgi:hypothetical protein